MNAMNPYLQQYKKNQFETATPEQLLILLYDAAIQYLNKTKIALDEANEEQFHSNILACQKIIFEFMNTLDMEQGGKLADTLYALYEYLYKVLVTASMSRKVEKINEVLRHLIGLRETWLKAIEISNAEKQANLMDYKEDYTDKYQNDDDDDDENEDEYDEEDDET